jgi:hypothetical protein
MIVKWFLPLNVDCIVSVTAAGLVRADLEGVEAYFGASLLDEDAADDDDDDDAGDGDDEREDVGSLLGQEFWCVCGVGMRN